MASGGGAGAGGGKKVAGAANFERRTWDKEEYAQKAAARQAAIEAGEDPDKPTELPDEIIYKQAAADREGPENSKRAFLLTRDVDLNLDSRVGQRKVIASTATGKDKGGYYCEMCRKTMHDNAGWLDHINGKKHMRQLGFSMRVKKSNIDDVKARLAMLRAKKQKKTTVKRKELHDYKKRLEEKEKSYESDHKKQRRRKKQPAKEEEEEAEAEAEEGIDPEMAAMMGFSGFSSKKKN